MKTSTSKKIKETYAFTQNGITVYIKIDYVNNIISLVEPWDEERSKFQRKRWLFSDRGVEYMQGWLNILEVMQDAIKDAKKKYEAELADKSEADEKFLIKMIKKSKNI